MKKIIFILLSIPLISSYLYKTELIELRVNIEKYTQRNIIQNSGFHKLALIIIQKVSQILPQNQHVDISRPKDQVGTGKYNPPGTFNNQVYENVYVSNTDDIIKAITNSMPGTIINIAPGEYTLDKGQYIHFNASGLHNAPIVLRASTLGSVTFNMQLKEGILLTASYVTIENIVFIGEKRKYDTIEHAFHIVGNADHVTITHNEFINFNAHIKANGKPNKDGTRDYPDYVNISHNNFYNQWKRNTASPASPIDVVGGKYWTVSNNFIADFSKSGHKGYGVTYGLFLKGASENGIIENNLVNCEWKIPHTSTKDVRIGISLGNGGTGKQFCMSNNCLFEHSNGVINNNTILNCKNDVAIYINKGKDTIISNNYIANSLGIEVRHSISSAEITNNFLDGRIKATQGAKKTTANNNSVESYLK